MGDVGGGSLISPDGVASSRIVGVSASVIFPCTTRSGKRSLLAPADLDSPGNWAIKQLCVCIGTGAAPGKNVTAFLSVDYHHFT